MEYSLDAEAATVGPVPVPEASSAFGPIPDYPGRTSWVVAESCLPEGYFFEERVTELLVFTVRNSSGSLKNERIKLGWYYSNAGRWKDQDGVQYTTEEIHQWTRLPETLIHLCTELNPKDENVEHDASDGAMHLVEAEPEAQFCSLCGDEIHSGTVCKGCATLLAKENPALLQELVPVDVNTDRLDSFSDLSTEDLASMWRELGWLVEAAVGSSSVSYYLKSPVTGLYVADVTRIGASQFVEVRNSAEWPQLCIDAARIEKYLQGRFSTHCNIITRRKFFDAQHWGV